MSSLQRLLRFFETLTRSENVLFCSPEHFGRGKICHVWSPEVGRTARRLPHRSPPPGLCMGQRYLLMAL